jgi:hypothetical protein
MRLKQVYHGWTYWMRQVGRGLVELVLPLLVPVLDGDIHQSAPTGFEKG